MGRVDLSYARVCGLYGVDVQKWFRYHGTTTTLLAVLAAPNVPLALLPSAHAFTGCRPAPPAADLPTSPQELGRPWSDVFVSIDPAPLASASVAQVHAAVLKGSNKQVGASASVCYPGAKGGGRRVHAGGQVVESDKRVGRKHGGKLGSARAS